MPAQLLLTYQEQTENIVNQNTNFVPPVEEETNNEFNNFSNPEPQEALKEGKTEESDEEDQSINSNHVDTPIIKDNPLGSRMIDFLNVSNLDLTEEPIAESTAVFTQNLEDSLLTNSTVMVPSSTLLNNAVLEPLLEKSINNPERKIHNPYLNINKVIEYIENGGAYAHALMNDKLEEIPHSNMEEYLTSINSLLWFFYSQGMVQSGTNVPFEEGSFRIEDSDHKFFNFFYGYLEKVQKERHLSDSKMECNLLGKAPNTFAYYRKSSHGGLKVFGIDYRTNQDQLCQSLFPMNKKHLLCSQQCGPNGKTILFLKPENNGLADIKEWLFHALEFVGSVGRKIGVGSNDHDNFAKEHFDNEKIKTEFKKLTQQSELPEDQKSLLTQQMHFYGLAGIYDALGTIQTYSISQEIAKRARDLRKNIRKNYGNTKLRKGNELVLTRLDLVTSNYYHLLKQHKANPAQLNEPHVIKNFLEELNKLKHLIHSKNSDIESLERIEEIAKIISKTSSSQLQEFSENNQALLNPFVNSLATKIDNENNTTCDSVIQFVNGYDTNIITKNKALIKEAYPLIEKKVSTFARKALTLLRKNLPSVIDETPYSEFTKQKLIIQNMINKKEYEGIHPLVPKDNWGPELQFQFTFHPNNLDQAPLINLKVWGKGFDNKRIKKIQSAVYLTYLTTVTMNLNPTERERYKRICQNLPELSDIYFDEIKNIIKSKNLFYQKSPMFTPYIEQKIIESDQKIKDLESNTKARKKLQLRFQLDKTNLFISDKAHKVVHLIDTKYPDIENQILAKK
ncbi:MAG: hypothetical protein M1114_02565 [Candidatus Dependentiae bacterium]|nr:hypothetical protein [Candidatus Dependentiae bacterium]